MRLFVVSLAVVGVLVSLLALSVHYSPDDEPEFSRPAWNSSLVNHSPYSVVYGIPVALLGVAGYAMLGLLAFYRRRLLTAICSVFGLAYAMYLTNIEAHVLDAWCVYCVVSFILITVIVFIAFVQLVSQVDQTTR
jgi:vitamin-K-epoxide reductase (warfarin-sensitive)